MAPPAVSPSSLSGPEYYTIIAGCGGRHGVCVFGAAATLRDSHTENFITATATTRTKPGFRLSSAFVLVTVMPLGGPRKEKKPTCS